MFPTLRTALPLLTPMALAALLSACTNAQDPRPAEAGAACDAAGADQFIGQNISGYIERQATQAAGATSSRVLRPDDVATMDFDPKRLNIHVDPGKVIIKLACG
ncbi:I78 family peptidase inhibitor [Herbaspirillum sp. alder98]|uniref:I78 family peptidase inhibitor n=1 Tax=Herbaspirillum sp. alder98 TaxID=2913096 RepID=UPI001CD8E313|nr:I78 family peptidase inhibitor [Herbaspirillum sp. alder98]MCA1322744.1 peptidase inhibitor [Herbaspirillum sp. alder98]